MDSRRFLKLTNTRNFDKDVCSEAHNLELDINEKSQFEGVRCERSNSAAVNDSQSNSNHEFEAAM